ncbi:MAG: MerR family transcriptional regulator [Kineosporiaceae bacterium]
MDGMLSIGDLARHAGVSVRMLRHWDALGLVVPARVDPGTGYRWYTPSQVGRVAGALALRDLGLTLVQCRDVLDERVGAAEFRAMLHRLEADVGQRLSADARRLDDIRRRSGSLERGLAAASGTFRLRRLPALRLLAVTTTVNDTAEIAGVVPGLAERLREVTAAAGPKLPGPRIHLYEGRPAGAGIKVSVGFDVPGGIGGAPRPGGIGGGGGAGSATGTTPARAALSAVDVPAEARGASVTYAGPASGVGDVWTTLDQPVAERGLRSQGPYRQVHLAADDDVSCVVEIQFPVRDAPDCP